MLVLSERQKVAAISLVLSDDALSTSMISQEIVSKILCFDKYFKVLEIRDALLKQQITTDTPNCSTDSIVGISSRGQYVLFPVLQQGSETFIFNILIILISYHHSSAIHAFAYFSKIH